MARNYIILNGVNSNTITGLLISTLPPITKPKIRTQIEEIDGRDGDIVTKLGYSAYEKEFEIGLYGDFDINQVISYFNSEGTVVFSNEEDKYYNYQILEQIDYEKLIRFKTATIKMHVQPFKYPTEEEQIQVDATVVTGSGSNITLEYTNAGNIITSEVDGDTQQDGTPTPTTPVAVQTVTGNQSIKIEGKNLFDINGNYDSRYGCTISITDNVVTQTNYSAYSRTSWKIENLVIGQQYTLYFNFTNSSGSSLQPRIMDSTNTTAIKNGSVRTATSGTSTTTFTATGTIHYIRLYSNTLSTSNAYSVDFYNIQLEKGDIVTDYEPYQSQTYPITLGTIELCKIGDYQDKIYQNEGTWYIEKQIVKDVYNGSEGWYVSAQTYPVFYRTFTGTGNYSTNNFIPYCNYYKGVSKSTGASDTASKGNNVISFLQSTTTDRIFITDDRFTADATGYANFREWLSNNHMVVYYVLATPTTTEITDADLLAQLNALAGATTYDNQTNIVVSGDLPASLSVSTQGMPNTVINNIGNIYAKPLITIYGSGNIGVYLNYIQVLQISLGDAGSITIDVAKMEAYNSSTQVLMNRLVTGDYMKFLINSGQNNIAFSGNVLGFTMDNYTRWV